MTKPDIPTPFRALSDLSNNGLDDDKVRMLASGLVENLSVTHLNLSHNKVCCSMNRYCRDQPEGIVGYELGLLADFMKLNLLMENRRYLKHIVQQP